MSPVSKPKKPLTPKLREQYKSAMRLSSEGRAAARNIKSHGDIHNAVTDKNLISTLDKALESGKFSPRVDVTKENPSEVGIQYLRDLRFKDLQIIEVRTKGTLRTRATFKKLDNGTWVDMGSPKFERV